MKLASSTGMLLLGIWLIIYAPCNLPHLAGDEGTFGDGPLPAGTAALQLAFRVAPHLLDGCHETLKAKGVEILSPPRDIPAFHHRALFFRDPEGNVVELYAEV